MERCQPAGCHDQAAARGAREGRDGAFDLTGIAHVDRSDLHLERRRGGLDIAHWAGQEGTPEFRSTATRVAPGAICLSTSSHLALRLYSSAMKPVALPPGRARLSTKPAPTGSVAEANTIGTMRVACINGPTTELPPA